MKEEFIEKIYATVIVEHQEIYKDLFENTQIDASTINYWKNAITLFDCLNENQKQIFFDVVRQVMIDTVSEIFGIIDGSSTLEGGNLEINMKIEGEDTEQELQDLFLQYVEEQQNE